jgi:hypothetical protein
MCTSIVFISCKYGAENPRGGVKFIAYDFIELGAWPWIGHRHGREQVLGVFCSEQVINHQSVSICLLWKIVCREVNANAAGAGPSKDELEDVGGSGIDFEVRVMMSAFSVDNSMRFVVNIVDANLRDLETVRMRAIHALVAEI